MVTRTLTRSPKPKSLFRTVPGVLFLVALLSTGAALAAFSIGSFTNTFNQTAATQSPSAPAGWSFVSSEAAVAADTLGGSSSGKCTSTDSSTSSSPNTPASGSSDYVCLNSVVSVGFGASDYLWFIEITIGTSATVSTTYAVQVGIASLSLIDYEKTPATISSTITLYYEYDLTAASVTSVSLVNVLITQCVSSTCQ